MKKLLNIMSGIALVFAFTVVATGNEMYQGGGTGGSAMDISALKATDVIGFNVENAQGERLGKISDIAFDPRSGRVTLAVIQEGEGAIGGKFIPVPVSALTFRENRAMLNMTREQLAAAPSFAIDDLAQMTDPAKTAETYRYFGVQPYWDQQGPAGPERERPGGGDDWEGNTSPLGPYEEGSGW